MNRNSKKSNYVLRIICEGCHTESLFFNSLRDDILEGKYNLGNVTIKIKPEPIIEKEDNNIPVSNRGKYIAKPKKSKDKPLENDIIKGPPPLCWISAGIKDLEDGIDEVWTAFDKDRHPKVQEAFELAQKEINGERVNIAFSSICFEYYLLIHFEKIYKVFEKSECNEKEYSGKGKKRKSKTKLFHCMTDKAIADKACNGDKCVNGYARSKGYWTQTKSNESTYPLVKDKLIYGICNAVWLRKQSEQNEPNIKFYFRNPFITIDKLTERLIGVKYIDKGEEYKYNSKNSKLIFQRKDNGTIRCINQGKVSIIIDANSFEVLNNGIQSKIGNKHILSPKEECEFEELDYIKKNLIYIFNYEDKKLIFHNY